MALKLTPKEIRDLVATIRQNRKKLADCEGPHNFVDIASDPRTKRCTKCRGTLNAISVKWYNDGLKHGKLEREDR